MNYEVVCGDDREIFVSVIEGYKALKNVPASGLSCSYNNLRRIRFWQVEVDFPSHGSRVSLAFLLSKSVVHGRCEVTPLHIVGTIDRVNRCDGYCDKLVIIVFSTRSLLLA
nr:uncharacterized protein LOC131771259 [Pocillopora verrucosa]